MRSLNSGVCVFSAAHLGFLQSMAAEELPPAMLAQPPPGRFTAGAAECLRPPQLHGAALACVAVDPLTDLLARDALLNGTLSEGDYSLFAPLASKLHYGACVNVVVIGGSVTCGTAITSLQQELLDSAGCGTAEQCSCAGNGCKKHAWPTHLQRALNARHPGCLEGGGGAKGQHRVANLCRGGVASDFWIDAVSAEIHAGSQTEGGGWGTALAVGGAPLLGLLNGADLVLVDTAMNDVMELSRANAQFSHLETRSRIQHATEMLVLLLLPRRKPNGSAVKEGGHRALAWVSAATRSNGAPDVSARNGRTSDAVALHLPVMAHHGVMQLSLIDALLPLDSEQHKQWYVNYLLGDALGHPSLLGHQLLASLIVQAIGEHVRSFLSAARAAEAEGEAVLRLQVLPQPPVAARLYKPRRPWLFVTDEELDRYESSHPLYVRLDQNNDTAYRYARWMPDGSVGGSEWDERDDRHPGLVANVTGAAIAWVFDGATVARHVHKGALHVTSMKSYERFGAFRVTVIRADEASSEPEASAARTLDAEPRLLHSWVLASGASGLSGALALSSGQKCGLAADPLDSSVPPVLRAGHHPVAEQVIECRWQKHVSEYDVDEINFGTTSLATLVAGAGSRYCIIPAIVSNRGG